MLTVFVCPVLRVLNKSSTPVKESFSDVIGGSLRQGGSSPTPMLASIERKLLFLPQLLLWGLQEEAEVASSDGTPLENQSTPSSNQTTETFKQRA